MSMKDWAKREIEIAIAREKRNAPVNKWDYEVGCYESAYKAYASLMEDDHSGTSFYITRNILSRLMDGKPLTPIEDTDDNWNEVTDGLYQSTRMSSLFKKVDDNGNISYSDNGDYYCIEVNDEENTFTSGGIRSLVGDFLPKITMPYVPNDKRHKIYVESFEIEGQEFRTIHYIIRGDNGEKVNVGIIYRWDDEESWVVDTK